MHALQVNKPTLRVGSWALGWDAIKEPEQGAEIGWLGLGVGEVHRLPSTQEEIEVCVGWGESASRSERLPGPVPLLEAGRSRYGASLTPLETHRVGGTHYPQGGCGCFAEGDSKIAIPQLARPCSVLKPSSQVLRNAEQDSPGC